MFAMMMKSGEKPDVFTYNVLIDACCSSNNVDEAKELFDSMVNRGFVPDVQNYNILINGYCNIDRVDEAMNLLKEMSHKNLVPSIVTYNSLIRGLCKLGRMPDVQELVDEMHDNDQPADVVTYNILLDTFCKTQHFDKAIAFFHQILVQGIWPDLDDVVRYDDWRKGGRPSWPETNIECGRLQTVEEIFRNLLVKGCHPNVKTYTIMIGGLCRDGLLDEAVALLSKMEDNNCLPDVVTFGTIISAMLKKNKSDKAEELHLEMIARGLAR
ncbi:putative pentatricopeptide repeat-containing protein [Senna tora]|uniref:Putative pentatricopeptide repeat-containing protein n=1 Tax=Senna tora TaxID=362788 RepID=A0A835C9X2_9FABA|nr:putative pentatricopeptide repeat-containing protein [Senna tora]